MKKLFFITAVTGLTIGLTACGPVKSEKEVLSEVPTEEPTTNALVFTDVQKEVFFNELNGVIKDVEYMSRGELNQYLVGTGHELFNPSSGVIRNGVKYEADSEFDYTKSSDSTKKITMDEVVEFRNKELDMRIEDLVSYKYTVQKVGKKYFLYAPIEGYKDTSMCFFFRLETDGTIFMDCPYILYHINKGSCYAGYKFSILSDEDRKRIFFKNYDADELNNSIVMDIQYRSPTNKFLVLKITNYDDKEYDFPGKCKIYSVTEDGGKDKEVCGAIYKKQHVGCFKNNDESFYQILDVDYDKELPSGDYIIEVEADGENKLVKDLHFTIE